MQKETCFELSQFEKVGEVPVAFSIPSNNISLNIHC